MRADFENKQGAARSFYTPPIAPTRLLDGEEDFFQVSPQASLSWHMTSNHTAYVLVTRGYKAGGFNPVSPAGGEVYDEETSWNYELGVKTSWLNDRLTLRAAVFYLDWQDVQLNLPTGAPAEFYIDNAGAASSKGVELELAARPLPQWTVFAAAGYTDAEFQSGARAGHIDAFQKQTVENVSGNQMPYAPEFTITSGTQYNWEVGRGVTLYARAEVTAFGEFYYNAANTASQEAFSLANFRAGIRKAGWFAEGWVRNAFDTDYVPLAFEFPNGASGMVGEAGAPVTFGIRAGAAF